MTERLIQAVEQAAAHLSDESQELLANALTFIAQDEHAIALLLIALNEAKWNATFARSQDKLKQLADLARQAYVAGEVEDLDLNKL